MLLSLIRQDLGLSEKELVELLNGGFEIEDQYDEELLLDLWDEAAEAESEENEMDYDEPEEWLEF